MQKTFCDKCGKEIIEIPLEKIGLGTENFYGGIEYYRIELCEQCQKNLQKELESVLKNYDNNNSN